MQKNITLSAEENLIERARHKAQKEHTTLNTQFRQWLEQYVAQDQTLVDFDAIMRSLSYAQPGGKFTRDVLNER